MSMQGLVRNGMRVLKKNSPEILSGLAVAGVAATSYLVAKATFKAAKKIEEAESKGGVPDNKKELAKERVKLVWKDYVPAAATGMATVGCVVLASRAGHRRTTAAFAAYSLSERAFAQYKEKIVEQIGKGKEEKVRTEIAADKVGELTKKSGEIIIIGDGDVMCCDLYSHRFFRSNPEKLRRIQNEINHRCISEMGGVSIDEFYDQIDLEHTSHTWAIGWDYEKLLEFQFHYVPGPNQEPCLGVEFNYKKEL